MRKLPRINAGVSVVCINRRCLKATACSIGDLSKSDRLHAVVTVSFARHPPPQQRQNGWLLV